MNVTLGTATAAAVLWTAAVALAAETQPAFDITTRKPEDRVAVAAAADGVIFTVSSRSGIGSATITPQGAAWPKSVVVRLRLAGLESLRISQAKTTLSAAVSSHGDNRTTLQLLEADKEKQIDRNSPYWTEIKILDAQGKPTRKVPVKDGYFELTLPARLLRGEPKSLSLSWIDFYRG